ncbi:Choline trimethylamine-lyase activating enzyme [Candidatus Lokiarchaeum ossiferum]|uniref:Choline trimethylamine-lyase activating enzyme n=1 Tax=Candidatus Lokiarchaeum ossiferum TaxID=2951803 RepID=A0ABY6HKR9_9ARCH|nr:Choline trimethylamine-lyase activating enzyme [Candidatus Lokiarchaeum sp. B-35]
MTEQKSGENGGWVFEIQKLSTEDGPGIRTTIFFKECPLRCAWCHNPESIWKKPSIQWFKNKCIGCLSCLEVCQQKAIISSESGIKINREKCTACGECVEECPSTALKMIGKYWSVEDLYEEIAKDRAFYDKSGGGITISGGEPTLQMDFLLALLKKCKANGFSTALDTCGLSSQKNYLKLLPLVDIFLLDIKEIDSKKHKSFVGHPNEKILANIRWLAREIDNQEKQLWIRTPIIPRYTASDENIRGIASFIVEELDNKIERWDILAFNNLAAAKYARMNLPWDFTQDKLFTQDEMEYYYDIAISIGVHNVKWSGLTRKV